MFHLSEWNFEVFLSKIMVNTKTLMYTEAETEKFYDAEDGLYRSFWDSEGSLHWGYFDNLTSTSKDEFLLACKRWNEYMLSRSNITNQSKVLDIGCGNGNTAVWLAQQTGCEVVGVDLSQVRIDKAKDKAKDYPKLSISFQKASATNLPFLDGEFTHVWSQATIYHIHDRTLALQEIHRVLKEGGTFLFDDLVTPIEDVSEIARKYLYKRLLFEPTFSQDSYAKTLSQLGLMVLQSEDLSAHLHKSYQLLSQLALPEYPDLHSAYIQISEAVEGKELGWSFFLCEKVSDRLTWIHENKDTQELRSKYDAWAKLYESDIRQSWEIMPMNAASMLKQLLPHENIAILDAGAGSGMVGEALNKQGYKNITAIDLSQEMLEIARKKQVYKLIEEVNLEKPINLFEKESFDAILAIGVFTYGHASPAGLYHLLPLVKRGGIFILTVRLSNKPMQEAFTKLPWTLISQQEYLFEGAPFHILAYRKN